MRLVFIDGQRDQFPIQRMCSMMGVSTSGYYAWRDRPLSQRSLDNQKLLREIRAIHAESRKIYGSPRIHAKLAARGFWASKNRVARLMRAEDIRSKRKRRRIITTNSKHAYPIAPNLLQRDFQATEPNQKWLGDITCIPTDEGFLYLAAILDLFSRKIVGWAMEDTMESYLVEQAFTMAVLNRKQVEGLLHHTDRGSQYASGSYQELLTNFHIQVSMSRSGDCYDNAPMESFFSTLKCELVHLQYYRTRLEARTDIFPYIEGFYNRTRLHSSLGYHSPDEFERWYYDNLS
jgi:transposase InsO family protein